jgi:hypothetical protein
MAWRGLFPSGRLRQNEACCDGIVECDCVRQLELIFGAGLREPDQEPYGTMNVRAPGIVPPIDGRQSQTALKVARGTARLLYALGFCVVSELPLASGRRADLVAIGRDGEIWIVEIKSSVADFRADNKWMDYRMHCDRLFFATTVEVPCEIFPPDTGLIVADAFGAQIVCEAPEHRLHAATRKSMTLAIARAAALRLQSLVDPAGPYAGEI